MRTRERDAQIVARVVDDGLTLAKAAAEFDISSQRANQILEQHFAAEAARDLSKSVSCNSAIAA